MKGKITCEQFHRLVNGEVIEIKMAGPGLSEAIYPNATAQIILEDMGFDLMLKALHAAIDNADAKRGKMQ
jgi:hypothetical protein